MHNTCIKHGRNIKTRYNGSTSILLLRKDWHSIRLDRMQSSFKKHFQLIVFQKLLDWKLVMSYTRKYMRHLVLLQRSTWNMTGWKNWVQKLLNDQKDKLFNNLKVSSQTNQIQTQIMMIERWHPLFAVTQVTHEVQDKHVHLMTARASTLKIKQNMIERWHPLFAVTQVKRKEPPKHVPLVKARTSSLETKKIMIERGHPLFAVTQVTRKVTSNQCWTRWSLTNTWIATSFCETSWELSCSWIGQEDREPPSPTCSSTRSTTKQSLEPVQFDDKENDSGRGQRRAVWTVWDGP